MHYRAGLCRMAYCGIIVLWLCASQAFAGAWPLPKGEGQAIVTSTIARADKAFDSAGDISGGVDYLKFDNTIYWEHGLTDRWTLVFKPSLQDVDLGTTAGRQSHQGLGPTEIAARRLMWKNDQTVISAQASVIFASQGENVPEAALGEGGTDYEIRGLIGRSLVIMERKGFAEAQFAYREREGRSPDEWRLDLTAGLRPVPNWQVIGQVFALKGEGAKFPRRDYESVKTQASIVYDKSVGASYQAGIYQSFAGKDIIRDQGAFFGIWLRY